MTTDPSKRRRWFQFRLRTLLIAVLVLSLPLSWFGVRMERARKQREAVAAIRRLGGYILYDWELTSGKTKRSSTWWRRVLGHDYCDKVVHVEIANTQNGDAVLEHLKDLPDLESLALIGNQVTDTLLEHFEGLTNLRVLGLIGNQFTDVGLEHLRGLNNLECLALEGTQITDAGLEHLEKLSNLRSLYLTGTQVTDSGTEHLKRMPKLSNLCIHGTNITPKGVKKLQEALPNCKIEY